MTSDQYHELNKAIDSSFGYKIECHLREIWVSHRVYQLNFVEFANALLEGSDFRLALSKFHQDRKDTKDDSAFVKIVQLLHNYVAGVKSLVDHTRIIVSRLIQAEHMKVYNDRLKSDFIDDPASRFLHDLRNYLLHCGHLPVAAVFNFRDELGGDRQATSLIVLSTKKASEWDGWKQLSREFLSTNGPDIQLLGTIKGYDQKVHQFYEWLLNYVREIFKDEMTRFEALQDEMRELYRESGIFKC